MSYETYSVIKASPKFWRSQMTKQIINATNSDVYHSDDEKIFLTSWNCSADKDIAELSRANPEETFTVMHADEDIYENLETTYTYLSGVCTFIKQAYEYIFSINVKDKEKLDPDLYSRFIEKTSAYFLQADNYRVRTSEEDPTFRDQPIKTDWINGDSFLTPIIEYREGNITLIAKKIGMTYLDVKVEIKEVASPMGVEKEDNDSEYYPLPF
jgi:hypothetical protein